MEKKVNRINIYLNNKERQILNQMKYKYHLSYSTIANILGEILIEPLKLEEIKTYIYEDKTKYKTSIKPKDAYKYENRTQIYTNLLKIYCRNELNKYLPQSKIDKYQTSIYIRMNETQDDNWNGNQFNRQMVKWLKHNKEYATKIIEGEK